LAICKIAWRIPHRLGERAANHPVFAYKHYMCQAKRSSVEPSSEKALYDWDGNMKVLDTSLVAMRMDLTQAVASQG
jgi:hypothetical protein